MHVPDAVPGPTYTTNCPLDALSHWRTPSALWVLTLRPSRAPVFLETLPETLLYLLFSYSLYIRFNL